MPLGPPPSMSGPPPGQTFWQQPPPQQQPQAGPSGQQFNVMPPPRGALPPRQQQQQQQLPSGPSREPSAGPRRSSSQMDHMDDFGDMGAAAMSYVANTPKGPPVPTPSVPGVTCPSRPDSNPYRRQHGLVVWDASQPDAPVPEPYQNFEDFRGISNQLLNRFRSEGFAAPTPIQVSKIHLQSYESTFNLSLFIFV